MAMFLAALIIALEDPNYTIRAFQPIPEESEAFLEMPVGIAIDGRGRLLALDISAKRVFVWNKAGSYVGAFGREGEGPGEFSFNSVSRRQGLIMADDRGIYVLEAERNALHTFDLDFSHRDSGLFEPTKGRARQWGVLKSGRLVMHIQDYLSGAPFNAVYAIESPSEPRIVGTLRPVEKTAEFRYETGKNNRRKYTLTAFAPEPFLYASDERDWALIGHGENPEFHWVDSSGRVMKRVALPIKRKLVRDEDIDEFKRYYFLQLDLDVVVRYPEVKPYYNFIYPVGDLGYLVGYQSPVFGKVDAYEVSQEGEVRRELVIDCGEGGGVLGARGRVFVIRIDDYGDYHLGELTFK